MEIIPTQLGQLSSLVALDLTDTGTSGTLPAFLGLLPHLRRLILSRYQLSGSIPSELDRLSSHLNWLDLSYTDINGTLPPELGKLTQLEHLDVSILDLSSNGLTGTIPTELGQLSKLEYIHWGSLTVDWKRPVRDLSTRRVLYSVTIDCPSVNCSRSCSEFNESWCPSRL